MCPWQCMLTSLLADKSVKLNWIKTYSSKRRKYIHQYNEVKEKLYTKFFIFVWTKFEHLVQDIYASQKVQLLTNHRRSGTHFRVLAGPPINRFIKWIKVLMFEFILSILVGAGRRSRRCAATGPNAKSSSYTETRLKDSDYNSHNWD